MSIWWKVRGLGVRPMKALACALFTLTTMPSVANADDTASISRIGVDTCRLDNTLPAPIPAALTSAWEVAALQYPRAPKSIAINPLSASHALAVFFVKDQLSSAARCGISTPPNGDGSSREFDTQTVIGLCQARPQTRTLICSSNAVRALLDLERKTSAEFAARGNRVQAVEMDNSPSLIYLFAHEFGHILLEHSGAYFDGVMSVHLSENRAMNIEAFARACEADDDQIQREAAADAFAFKTARDVFARPPFRSESSLIGAISSNSELIYWTNKAFAGWSAQYYGDFQGSPVPNARQLCEMTAEKSGTIVSPVFGGGHPQLWSRLAAEVTQASQYIATLQSQQPEGKEKDTDKQIAAGWERNRLLDSVLAQGMEQAAAAYCTNIAALREGHIDCNNPPEPTPSGTQVFIEGEADATPGTYQAWFRYAQGNRERKQWQAARRAYEQALPLAREASDQVYIANILNDLGVLDLMEGHAGHAEKAFKEAVDIRRTLVHQDADKHSQELAGALFNLGYLYAKEHRTTDARGSLSESLDLFRSIQKLRPGNNQPQIQKILDILDTLPK